MLTNPTKSVKSNVLQSNPQQITMRILNNKNSRRWTLNCKLAEINSLGTTLVSSALRTN